MDGIGWRSFRSVLGTYQHAAEGGSAKGPNAMRIVRFAVSIVPRQSRTHGARGSGDGAGRGGEHGYLQRSARGAPATARL